MKRNNIISDWLNEYGDPEIDKFVENQLNQNKMKQTAVEWLLLEMSASDWDDLPKSMKQDIIEQANEMEEKQMINFAEFVATYPDKNVNINGEMLHAKSKYDGAERTIDLLKEYYESKTNL
jgi:hypothetical protein